MLRELTKKLKEKGDLAYQEVEIAIEGLIDEKISPEIKADFLIALNQKGETVDEIEAFAKKLKSYSIAPPISDELRNKPIIDVCGTGGDKLGTINISSAVAIIVASAGVYVVKHGNRAATSKSGSADVFEALGIKIILSPEEAAKWLKNYNFAFLFAPYYHPAFKHIAPARKICGNLGYLTIFNFLGPLFNPANPNCQIIGVPNPNLCEPMARALQRLGVLRGMVVCGRITDKHERSPEQVHHLDEISINGNTVVAEFYQEKGIICSELDSTIFPVTFNSIDELRGGDSATNAGIMTEIFQGKIKGGKRDIIQLNAAAALFVAGVVRSITDGWELAGELIDSGAAHKKMQELIKASK